MQSCVNLRTQTFVAVLACGLATAASASAVEPFTSASWSFFLRDAGTYVFRDTNDTYDRAAFYPEATAGQIHSGTDPFWFYRGYMVFDVPTIPGVHTAADFGLSPDEVGNDPFTVRLSDLSLRISNAVFTQSPIKDIPIRLRVSSLSAEGLMDATLDPEVAYQGLGAGALASTYTFPASALSEGLLTDVSVPFNDAFRGIINGWTGSPLVLSFTMPFLPDFPLDRGDGYEIVSLEGVVIEGTMNFYAVSDLSAIPEPSTYGMFAIVLLGAAGLYRRRRRPPESARRVA